MLHDKIIPFLRKPWLFLGLWVLAYLAGIAVNHMLPVYLGSGLFPDTAVQPDAVRSIAVSADGTLALNNYSEVYSYLYSADPASGKMHWLAKADTLQDYCGEASRYDLAFGDQDTLFLHYVTWTEDENAIETEQILRISADGTPGQVLCGMDYARPENPPKLCSRR